MYCLTPSFLVYCKVALLGKLAAKLWNLPFKDLVIFEVDFTFKAAFFTFTGAFGAVSLFPWRLHFITTSLPATALRLLLTLKTPGHFFIKMAMLSFSFTPALSR